MSRTVTNKTAYDLYAYSGASNTDQTSLDNTIKFIIKPGQTITWTDTSTQAFFIGVQYTYSSNFLYRGTSESGSLTRLIVSKEIRLQDKEADTYTLKTISTEYYNASSTAPLFFYDNPDGTDTSGSATGGGGTSGGGTSGGGTSGGGTSGGGTSGGGTSGGGTSGGGTSGGGTSGGDTTPKTKTISYTLDSHTTATPASFTEGDLVTITLTADAGYYIKTAEGQRFNYDTEKDESIVFTISTDKKTATATVKDTSDYGIYEVRGDSDASQSTVTLDGLTSIYLPTDAELGEIGKLRYTVTTSSSTADVVDLGAYIVNYIKMFIDVTPDGKTDCVLGYFNTQIEVDYTNNQIQEIDCGSVTVNEINKNVTDYTDVDSKIFLPFIGMIDIDSKKIMEKTINLKYRINLINGDCVALLYSDSVLISVSNGQVGYKMPYVLNDNLLTAVENYSFNGQYLLDKNPYLLIYYKNQISNSTNYNGNAWYTINDLNGYTTFTDVVITGLDCTIDELTEIEQILKSGVIL